MYTRALKEWLNIWFQGLKNLIIRKDDLERNKIKYIYKSPWFYNDKKKGGNNFLKVATAGIIPKTDKG